MDYSLMLGCSHYKDHRNNSCRKFTSIIRLERRDIFSGSLWRLGEEFRLNNCRNTIGGKNSQIILTYISQKRRQKNDCEGKKFKDITAIKMSIFFTRIADADLSNKFNKGIPYG